MRGTHVYENKTAAELGITPAHAGNTDETPQIEIAFQDHPRPCGEHTLYFDEAILGIGSPPPMRGTHPNYALLNSNKGITPAHAGNTIL